MGKEGDWRCPQCGREVKIKSGKYGEFVGCTGFPHCRWTTSIDDWEESHCNAREWYINSIPPYDNCQEERAIY